jgi:hypothetical protein
VVSDTYEELCTHVQCAQTGKGKKEIYFGNLCSLILFYLFIFF